MYSKCNRKSCYFTVIACFPPILWQHRCVLSVQTTSGDYGTTPRTQWRTRRAWWGPQSSTPVRRWCATVTSLYLQTSPTLCTTPRYKLLWLYTLCATVTSQYLRASLTSCIILALPRHFLNVRTSLFRCYKQILHHSRINLSPRSSKSVKRLGF